MNYIILLALGFHSKGFPQGVVLLLAMDAFLKPQSLRLTLGYLNQCDQHSLCMCGDDESQLHVHVVRNSCPPFA